MCFIKKEDFTCTPKPTINNVEKYPGFKENKT